MNNDKKMAAESDKCRIKDVRDVKEMDTRNGRKIVQFLARRTVSSNTCTLEQTVQCLDVQIQGRQNATIMSVCVKGETARAEEQCA